MGDVLSPFTVSSPPPLSSSSSDKNNSMPMLYYGLVVVGTAAIVLAVYNLVLLKRSQARSRAPPGGSSSNGLGGRRRIEGVSEMTRSMENQERQLLSSFKYKKEVVGKERELEEDFECPVCLSVYEEGEEVRKLPQCKHCFHVLCIDMWLYSHFDCPICRTPVVASLDSLHGFIESSSI